MIKHRSSVHEHRSSEDAMAVRQCHFWLLLLFPRSPSLFLPFLVLLGDEVLSRGCDVVFGSSTGIGFG